MNIILLPVQNFPAFLEIHILIIYYQLNEKIKKKCLIILEAEIYKIYFAKITIIIMVESKKLSYSLFPTKIAPDY